jgi:hypothetical protein
VNYKTDNGNDGYTDSDGKFTYNSLDTTITFKIGKLVIVENFKLSNINNGVILPVDIVNDKKTGTQLDRNNTTNENVIKILRVLQSLDDDNNASNGILIDGNTKGYLATEANLISDNITKLKTIVEKTGKTLIKRRKARNHYIKTLKDSGVTPELMPFIIVLI